MIYIKTQHPTGHELLLAGDILGVEELGGEVESWLRPLDVEVEREGDAVVLVVDLKHVGDLYA